MSFGEVEGSIVSVPQSWVRSGPLAMSFRFSMTTRSKELKPPSKRSPSESKITIFQVPSSFLHSADSSARPAPPSKQRHKHTSKRFIIVSSAERASKAQKPNDLAQQTPRPRMP